MELIEGENERMQGEIMASGMCLQNNKYTFLTTFLT